MNKRHSKLLDDIWSVTPLFEDAFRYAFCGLFAGGYFMLSQSATFRFSHIIPWLVLGFFCLGAIIESLVRSTDMAGDPRGVTLRFVGGSILAAWLLAVTYLSFKVGSWLF
jgi:hypothetical protein